MTKVLNFFSHNTNKVLTLNILSYSTVFILSFYLVFLNTSTFNQPSESLPNTRSVKGAFESLDSLNCKIGLKNDNNYSIKSWEDGWLTDIDIEEVGQNKFVFSDACNDVGNEIKVALYSINCKSI